MVQCPTVNRTKLPASFLQNFFEKASRPLPVVHIRSRANKRQGMTKSRHPGCVSPEFSCVFFRCKVSTAAPRLVSHTPKTYVKGFGKSRGASFIGQGCASRRRVAIFDPTIEFFRGQASKIRRQVGFTTDQFAEMAEFVRSEFVWI